MPDLNAMPLNGQALAALADKEAAMTGLPWGDDPPWGTPCDVGGRLDSADDCVNVACTYNAGSNNVQQDFVQACNDAAGIAALRNAATALIVQAGLAAGLAAEVKRLRQLNEGLAERVAAQSELLSRRAARQ
jgi:hypothetical protein